MRWQTIYEARWIFVAILLLSALTATFTSFLAPALTPWASAVWLLFVLYVFYFFRDQERTTPTDPDLVVAAADGVVADIVEIEEPEVVKATMKRVAIFLSVFDVHTNRAPVAGTVTYTERRVGKMLDARHKDASKLNECRTWAIDHKTSDNRDAVVVVRQITGAIARRIIGWSKMGDRVKKGERFGMIRFGSRTEIYLPLECEILVQLGDQVKGGHTVIARFPAT